ncbi:MAG TPA: hypothetical protein VGY66_36785, partial [Gemmataceae bacterium]|nr:hypothetical protein [Gemmataceae bacterium]
MPHSWLKKIGKFTGRTGKRKRNGIHSSFPHYRRLNFEVLESRLAPAVVSTFTAATGLLSVISDAADTISLAVDAGSGDVLVNNSNMLTLVNNGNMLTSGPAAATAVQQIQISGGTQNNIFDLSQLTGTPLPNVTSFTVTGGGGNDTLIAPANQANSWAFTGQNQGGIGYYSIASVEQVSGGLGYAAGDVLTLPGGGDAQLTVTSVDDNGTVTGVDVTNGGAFENVTMNPVSSVDASNANASGANFNLTFVPIFSASSPIGFTSIQNLTGGNVADTYYYSSASSFLTGTINELPGGNVTLAGRVISIPGTITTNGGALTINYANSLGSDNSVSFSGNADTEGGNLTVYADTISLDTVSGPVTLSSRHLAGNAGLSTGNSGNIALFGNTITLGSFNGSNGNANLFSQADSPFTAGSITLTALQKAGAGTGNGLNMPILPKLDSSAASITVNGAQVMGGVVTFSAAAESLHVNSDPGASTAAKIIQTGINFLENFSLIGGWAQSDSNAQINLGASSSIVASSFSATASATSDAETAPTDIIGFGIAVAIAKTTAAVNAAGSITTTTADASLQSFANNTLLAMANEGGNLGGAGAGIAVAVENSTSTVNVANSAIINVTQGNLIVQANTINNKALLAETTTGSDGNIGLGAGIAYTNDVTTANLSGQATVGGDVTIQANEIKNPVLNSTFFGAIPINVGGVSVAAGVGTDDTGSPFTNQQSDLSSQLWAALKKLVGAQSDKAQASSPQAANQAPSFQAAAAVAVDMEVNTSTASVGANAIVRATGNVTVDANTNDRPGVLAGSGISTPPPSSGSTPSSTEFSGSVAVAIGLYSNTATADIDSTATVDAGRNLSVTSEALNDWQLQYLVNLYQSATLQPNYRTSDPGANSQQVSYGNIVELNDRHTGGGTVGDWYKYVGPGAPTLDLTTQDFTNTTYWQDLGPGWLFKFKGFLANLTTYFDSSFGADNNLADSWSQATALPSNPMDSGAQYALAGSFTLLTMNQTSTAYIGQGALINQDTSAKYVTGQQDVFVLATGTNSSVDLGGSVQFPGLTGSTNGNSFWPTPWGRGGVLGVNGPGWGNKASQGAIGAALVMIQYTDNVTATIDTGVKMYADSLEVDAETAVGNISSVISGAKSGNFGFNGVFSVVTINDTTLAQIAKGADIAVGKENVVEPFQPLPVITIGNNQFVVPNLTTSAIQGNALPGTFGTDAAGNPTDTIPASVVVQAHDSTLLFNLAGGIMSASNLSIGASVALDQVKRDTEALIGDSSTTAGTNNGSPTVTSAGHVIVDAKNSGVVGSLSLAGLQVSGPPDTNQVNSTASWVPSGLSINLPGPSSQYGIGICGDVSYNQVSDTTLAYVQDVTVTAPDLDVHATNNSLIVAASGSVAIVTSNAAVSVGLAGSYAQNIVEGATNSFVDNSTLTLSGNLTVDATGSEQIIAISASGSVTPAAASQQGINLAGQVSINSIGAATRAEILNQSSVTTGNTGNVSVTSTNKDGIFAVAGALASGGKAGIGAAVAVNSIPSSGQSDSVQANIQDSDVAAGGLINLDSESRQSIVSITAAIGLAQSGMAAALAISNNTISPSTEASIRGEKKKGVQAGGNLSVSAEDTSTIFALVGAGSGGSTQVSLGAAITSNTITENVQTQIESGLVSAGAVTVLAHGSANILSFALSGGGGNGAAAGGSYSGNTVGGSILAAVSSGAVVASTSSVDLEAHDDDNIVSVAGNGEGASNLAIGVAVSVNNINPTVQTDLSAAQITASAVTELAETSSQITSIAAAGGGSGGVAAGGGLSQNNVSPTIHADIINSQVTAATVSLLAQTTAQITCIAAGGGGAADLAAYGADSANIIGGSILATISGSTVNASTSLSLEALDAATIFSVAGNGEGAEGASLGGSFSQNCISATIEAKISSGQVTAPVVSLLAKSDGNIKAIAVGGAGAVGLAANGSDAANTIGGTVAASVNMAATVTAGSSLDIEAHEDASIFLFAGNGAGAVGAAVGVAIADNTINPTVQAQVSAAQASAPTVSILAATAAQISSIAIGGAGAEGVAAGASIVDNEIGSTIDAHVSGGSVVSATNGITITATDVSSISAVGGAAGGAVFVGVGVASTTAGIHDTVTAYVDASTVTSPGGNITVSATSTPSITSDGVAGGGAAGLGVAASVANATIATTTDAHFSHGANVSAGGGITAQAQFVPTTNIVAGGIAGGFLGIGASD